MASFGKFGSAWREKAFYTDPDQRLHVADPSHAERSTDPNPTWIAPQDIHDQPEYLYDIQPDDYIADGYGMVLNTTPYDHAVGSESGVTPSGVETVASNATSAGEDFGASRQSNYTPPLLQDSTTRYVSPRFEGLDATPVAPVALVRGLNSNAENNPEGFRRGWVEQTFTDRRMYDPERTHDRRLLTPNLPFVEADQEPVKGTNGVPFSSLARSLKSISQTPMVRREPPGISQSVETDGADEPYLYDAIPGDWMAG